MNKERNKQNEPMSVEELMVLMNLEESDRYIAESIYRTQNYSGMPTDPEGQIKHAHVWSNHDRRMGGLDQDFAVGRITEEEYITKKAEYEERAKDGEL